MRHSIRWFWIVASLTWAPNGAVSAELAGYLTVTSDSVYRGVTQSDGDPAAQFGLDLNSDSGWYAGVWAATIDISNGPTRQRDQQVNYYAGYSRTVASDWTLGGHIVAYRYPGADSDVDYDYTEYVLSAGFDDRWWLELAFSDDLYNTGSKTRNAEVYYEHPLAGGWVLGAGGGYYDVSDFVDSGYAYWQLGFTRALGVFDLDLRYHDANRWVPVVSSPERADARFAVSIRWSF